MDIKSKILLVLSFFLVFFSFGYTYYHTIVLQDFEVIYPVDAELE